MTWAPPQVQQATQNPQGTEKKKSKAAVFWILGGFLLLFVVTCSICVNAVPKSTTNVPTAPTPIQTPTPQVIQVSAAELSKAYEKNQVAADLIYEGKTLLVTGIVSSIGKDIFNYPYVVINDGSQFAINGVQCSFSKSSETELAKLSKGQTVRIQGTQYGYSILNVMLKDCSLK
jgi:hypothetical protein